jgi:hypothetical protein
MPVGSVASSPEPPGRLFEVPQAAPAPPVRPGQRQQLAATLGRRARPPVLADERALPVPAPLASLLPGDCLRRGSTVAVRRSVALALALVAEASASGSWVAAVGLPDLGVVAAAEAGIALDRLVLVPAPPPRTWAAVVAALLDAIDVVLVRPPASLHTADARRLAARARQRGAVLVPLGDAWTDPADLHLAVTASQWRGLGQGHGHLKARWVAVAAHGRGAAARERHAHLWLPAHRPSWDDSRPPGYVRPADHARPAGGWEGGSGSALPQRRIAAGAGRDAVVDSGRLVRQQAADRVEQGGHHQGPQGGRGDQGEAAATALDSKEVASMPERRTRPA